MKSSSIMLALVIYVFVFMGGWHQIDNAYNMKSVTEMMLRNGLDVTIHDQSILLKYDVNTLYMSGFFMIMVSMAAMAGLVIDIYKAKSEDAIIKTKYKSIDS